MTETRFTQDHEWVRLDAGVATIGITRFAADQLGDVVFVELPDVGRKVGAGAEAAVVESVKAASDVFAPLSGEVTAHNDAIVAEPAKVNDDPEGDAWFFKIKLDSLTDFTKLMTEAEYAAFVKRL